MLAPAAEIIPPIDCTCSEYSPGVTFEMDPHCPEKIEGDFGLTPQHSSRRAP